MNPPPTSRVTITDLPQGLEVRIRAGRAWQDIVSAIFPALLLVFFAWQALRGTFDDQTAILIWGAFACLLLYLVIDRALWLITGQEIITAADGQLCIQRKGLLVPFSTEQCPLGTAKNFTVQRETSYTSSKYHKRIMGRRGTIRFTCDGAPYRFGDMLSEPEAAYIIGQLRDKKLIS